MECEEVHGEGDGVVEEPAVDNCAGAPGEEAQQEAVRNNEKKRTKRHKGRRDMYKSQVQQKEDNDHNNSDEDKEDQEYQRFFKD